LAFLPVDYLGTDKNVCPTQQTITPAFSDRSPREFWKHEERPTHFTPAFDLQLANVALGPSDFVPSDSLCGGFGRLFAVTPVKTIDATGRINQLLLAGEKRVTC
jgi:hypothetical protein